MFFAVRKLPAWKQFHNGITETSLYSVGDTVIDQLVADLKKLPIIKLYVIGREYGTQVHFMYRLKDRGKAFFKPQRLVENKLVLGYVLTKYQILWTRYV